MTIEITKGNDNPVAEFFSSSSTPETDAATHDLSDYGSPVLCSWGDWVDADFARKLERERDEARHKLELCMAANSDVARIAKERNEAREALSKIDEIFCDGEDTHDDWMKMGIIAKDYLKGLE
jgi:hypothetical protein